MGGERSLIIVNMVGPHKYNWSQGALHQVASHVHAIAQLAY